MPASINNTKYKTIRVSCVSTTLDHDIMTSDIGLTAQPPEQRAAHTAEQTAESSRKCIHRAAQKKTAREQTAEF